MNIDLLQKFVSSVRHTLAFDMIPHVNFLDHDWAAIADGIEQLIQASSNKSGLDPEMGFILEGANVGELAAYEYAVASHCQATMKILNGEDSGQGANCEPWASVRKRLLDLTKNQKT